MSADAYTIGRCAWCDRPIPADRLISCSWACRKSLNAADERIRREERMADVDESAYDDDANALCDVFGRL